MRTKDIEMRVWDKRNKTMVYLNEFDMCDWSMASLNIYAEDNITHPEREFGYDLKDQVKNPPVMLFSGLRDANKKKIFEGDLLQIESTKNLQEVAFINGCFDICTPGNDDWERLREYIFTEKVFVVGNIYQNTELLKPV